MKPDIPTDRLTGYLHILLNQDVTIGLIIVGPLEQTWFSLGNRHHYMLFHRDNPKLWSHSNFLLIYTMYMILNYTGNSLSSFVFIIRSRHSPRPSTIINTPPNANAPADPTPSQPLIMYHPPPLTPFIQMHQYKCTVQISSSREALKRKKHRKTPKIHPYQPILKPSSFRTQNSINALPFSIIQLLYLPSQDFVAHVHSTLKQCSSAYASSASSSSKSALRAAWL